MRKCIRCNSGMIEDLDIKTNDALGLALGEHGLFKGTLGRIAAAACPECGYAEIYIKDTEKLKKLASDRK